MSTFPLSLSTRTSYAASPSSPAIAAVSTLSGDKVASSMSARFTPVRAWK
ncbi:MAG: hypothetical protein H6Q82_869 [Deltaproteobacteria bacterium]|nr:hypothetical protein [Deltaproteobacteria bacterium]